MHALSAAEILRIWDAGADQHPIDRALTILRVGSADGGGELAGLSIGERDRRLWELRERTFGSSVEAATRCPKCGEAVEFEFSSARVRVAFDDPSGREQEWSGGEWKVRFRLPASRDLAAVLGERAELAEGILATRCVLQAERNGVAAEIRNLPAGIWERVLETMSMLDPQAEVQFQLSCPGCGHQWDTAFDIAEFFWTELSATARRLIREVDLLARVYGWTESEVLRLSARRRAAYLELAGA
jgi:hypothetical protein